MRAGVDRRPGRRRGERACSELVVVEVILLILEVVVTHALTTAGGVDLLHDGVGDALKLLLLLLVLLGIGLLVVVKPVEDLLDGLLERLLVLVINLVCDTLLLVPM